MEDIYMLKNDEITKELWFIKKKFVCLQTECSVI